MHSYVIYCKSGGINFEWNITCWFTNPKSTYIIFSDRIRFRFNIIVQSKAMWFAKKSTEFIFNSNTQFRWMNEWKVSSHSWSLNITQIIPLVMFKRDSDSNRDSSDLFWDRVVFICSEPSIMKFANQFCSAASMFSVGYIHGCSYEWVNAVRELCLGKYTRNSLAQSLNSTFFPPHIGAEPRRAKEESRITCMRMLRTNQSKITRSQPRCSRQCVAQCLSQLTLWKKTFSLTLILSFKKKTKKRKNWNMFYRGLYSYRQRVRVITLFPYILFVFFLYVERFCKSCWKESLTCTSSSFA